MSKSVLKLWISLIVFSLSLLPGVGLAQEAGAIAESWSMSVKKGQQAQFEAAFKQHQQVRKANNDPRLWEVYAPVTGDHLNQYVVRTCCFSWADQDTYTAWTNGSPDVMADWFANVDQFVESYEHHFSEVDTDHSNWVEPGTAVNYVGVTDYYIGPGQGDNFAAARQQMSQIAIDQGWADGRHWAWIHQIGGKPKTTLAIPYTAYADMGANGAGFMAFLAEQMGEEAAAALMEEFTSSTRGSSYTIYAHRADLSN